ncbi:MAG: DUF4382 domain-containing protein [Gammaproteobacteria bacterium]|nr:DUF4382 domain-containing protein [Gammaproteobacteria bacterium]
MTITSFHTSRPGLRSTRQQMSAWLLTSILLIGFVFLTACGGGSTDTGEVQIGLTDAKGDFATYTVDVMSLTLTKQNGQVVETLPLNTRVDFAQYTDLTEFLTAATVPSGIYVKGTMRLDYSNADIWVEDETGSAIKVSTILDEKGLPVSELQVEVGLVGKTQLVIAPGIPAHLTLDFDLKQSNTVVFDDNNTPSITVVPLLIAEISAKKPKKHRVRGPLKEVSVAENNFDIYLRPFRHRLSENARHFGVLTVQNSDETVFEINGESYRSEAGLAELALQPARTAIIAIGDVRFNPRRFVAREVYAGSSVPGGDFDVVRGSVMARTGNILTVHGGTLTRADGTVSFSENITITLDESTKVTKQLSMGTFAIDDISVGQRITVFGIARPGSEPDVSFSAANGHVRMHISVARGSVQGVVFIPEQPPRYPFVLNLASINGRNVSLYNFAGTGIDSSNDATGDFYQINTGNLNVTGFAVDSRVAVGGFVTPFGSAPADFDAQTIVTMPIE